MYFSTVAVFSMIVSFFYSCTTVSVDRKNTTEPFYPDAFRRSNYRAYGKYMSKIENIMFAPNCPKKKICHPANFRFTIHALQDVINTFRSQIAYEKNLANIHHVSSAGYEIMNYMTVILHQCPNATGDSLLFDYDMPIINNPVEKFVPDPKFMCGFVKISVRTESKKTHPNSYIMTKSAEVYFKKLVTNERDLMLYVSHTTRFCCTYLLTENATHYTDYHMCAFMDVYTNSTDVLTKAEYGDPCTKCDFYKNYTNYCHLTCSLPEEGGVELRMWKFCEILPSPAELPEVMVYPANLIDDMILAGTIVHLLTLSIAFVILYYYSYRGCVFL